MNPHYFTANPVSGRRICELFVEKWRATFVVVAPMAAAVAISESLFTIAIEKTHVSLSGTVV